MSPAEARWISARLSRFAVDELSPMLNIGSSTRRYRTVDQPWNQEILFGPLEERGITVVHCDIKYGDGVDFVGDIMDDRNLALLRAYHFKSILCSNVLEHVLDPGAFCRRMGDVIDAGALLIVTVPRSHPYHRDPIDTMFRPTPDEIIALLPAADILATDIIVTGSYRDHVRRRPWVLLRHITRFPVPFLSWRKWKRSMSKLYWLVHPFLLSCVIARKR